MNARASFPRLNETPPHPSFTSRQAVWLVAFMWGAYFLNYCDRQAVFSMFPVLKRDLGATDEQLGLTGAIFLWVYGLGCPIAGYVGDRFSKRLLVVSSLAVWSIVTTGTGLANSATMLLTLRGAMGGAECLFMPAAISLTTQAFSPDQRSRAIATLTTAQIVGNVGGGWLGGWMAQHRSWREAFFVLGLIGVLYTAPYFSFLRGVREERPTEVSKIRSGSAIAELVRSPMFLLLCVVFPIFVFGLWLLYSWFPDFLYEKFSLDLAQAGRDATVYLQSATFIGILGGGVFADRLTRRTPAARCWLLVASFVLCAPCLYAIGQAHAVSNARLAAAAFGLFSGLLMGNIFPAAFEVVGGDARASAVGALNFCGAILSGCAALFGGMWKKSVGFERLLTATGIAYLCAAVLVVAGIRLFFARDRERIRASTG